MDQLGRHGVKIRQQGIQLPYMEKLIISRHCLENISRKQEKWHNGKYGEGATSPQQQRKVEREKICIQYQILLRISIAVVCSIT